MLEKICVDITEDVISGIIRPILYFSENDNLSDIWKSMLEKKEHISIITDEYGCMRGIVTMEDVIETMLSVEIIDECDTPPRFTDCCERKIFKISFIT